MSGRRVQRFTDRPLIATDLDRTLIYSQGAVATFGDGGASLVAVERYLGVDASWLTARAASLFAGLHRHAVIVPSTTRTVEQWRRIRLPGPAPRYAVAANGGVLLVDDVPDERWGRTVRAVLAGVVPADEVGRHVESVCRRSWTKTVRRVDELFCYAVLDRGALPDSFVSDERQWAAARGWRVSLQGRKIYWVPEPLTKSAAVAEVARRAGSRTVLAAGDSLLDADLLSAADAGILARHGELAASGWHADHVSVTAGRGVLAGEEIARWMCERTAEIGSLT